MKNTFLSIFFFIFLSAPSFSQTLIQRPLIYDDYNSFNQIIKLHNGGYAIAAFCGYYFNVSHADAIMSKGIVVLDSSANVVWYNFKDPGSIMAEYFYPEPDLVQLHENEDSSIYLIGEWISGKTGVVKYDSSGNTIWVQSTPDTAGLLIPFVVCPGDSNSLYISGGRYYGLNSGIFLTKIDSSGNFIFRSYYLTTLLEPNYMEYDSVGNLRVFINTNEGNKNGHIITFDSTGNFLSDDSLMIHFNHVLKKKNGNYLFSVLPGQQFILTDSYFNIIRTMNFPDYATFISEREDSGYVAVGFSSSIVYKTDTMMNKLWSVSPYFVSTAYSENDSEFYAVGSPYISYRDTNYFVLLRQQPYFQINASPNPVCRFDSVQLSVPSGFSQYEWSNNDSTNPTYVDFIGNYFATLEDTSHVIWYTDTVHLTSFPWQYIYLGPDTITCVNQPVTFHGGTQFASWQWQDGSTDSVFTINSAVAGNFMVSVISTDTNGCDAIDSVSVTFDLCDGIKNIFLNAEMVLYPNPSSGNISIVNPNTHPDKGSIWIFDFTGREVFHQELKEKINELNVSFLTRGVYQCKVSSGSQETKYIKLEIQ